MGIEEYKSGKDREITPTTSLLEEQSYDIPQYVPGEAPEENEYYIDNYAGPTTQVTPGIVYDGVEEETAVWDATKGGFLQGMSGGYSDEVGALYDSFSERPEGEAVFGKTYYEMRDENRDYLKQLEEEHGTAYFLGGLTGNVAATAAIVAATGGLGGTAAVGSLAGVEGVAVAGRAVAAKALAHQANKTLLQKAGQAATKGALVGTAEGGVTGLGLSEAEITKGELGEAVRDAANMALVGGVMGAAVGAGLTGMGYVGKGGPEKLGNKVASHFDDTSIPGDIIDVAEAVAQKNKTINDAFKRTILGEPEEVIENLSTGKWGRELPQIAGGDEEAATLLRTELRGFLNYVGIPVKTTTGKNAPKMGSTEKFLEEGLFREALKQAKKEGKLTSDTFNEFKRSKNMTEAAKAHIHHERAALNTNKAGKETGSGQLREVLDSVSEDVAKDGRSDAFSGYRGWFNRKVMNPFVSAGRIDKVSGLGLEGAMYRAVQNDILATNYSLKLSGPLKKLEKKARAHDVFDDPNKITEAIERGEAHEILEVPRKLLREAKEFLDEQGFKFAGRGEDYVPHMRKRGSAYLQAMIDKSKTVMPELQKMEKEELNKFLRSVAGEPDIGDAIDEAVNALVTKTKPRQPGPRLGKRDDMRMFIHELNSQNGTPVKSLKDIEVAQKELGTYTGAKKTLSREVSFAKGREGEVPEFLREKDIYKLLHNYHALVGDVVFKQQSVRELSGLQSILANQFKMKESAEWLGSYVQDYAGQYRNVWGNKARALKTNMEVYLNDKPTLQAMFEMSDLFTRSIYPNMLGFNVRAVARNLTQPWVMTLAEAGPKANTAQLLGAYKRVIKNYKKVKEELYERGYAKREFTEEDVKLMRNAVIEGHKNKGITVSKEVIDKYNHMAMTAYRESDTWNRAVTLEFTKGVAQKIIQNPSSLKKFKGHVSPGTIRNMNRALKKGDAQLVEDIFTDYFMAKTQLIYGKTGMHEFGRDMGPFFSMFTAWPSYVYSDIYDKLSQKQFARFFAKYMGPWAIGTGLSAALIGDKPNKRTEELVGRGGFQSTVPLYSVMGMGEIFGHKLLSTGMKGVADLNKYTEDALKGDKRAQKKVQQVGKRLRETFVPLGGIPRQAEHLINLFGPEGSRSAR